MRLLILLVAIGVVLAVAAGFPAGAAEAKCDPHRSNYGGAFIGQERGLYDVTAVQSRMYNYDPWVYWVDDEDEGETEYTHPTKTYVEMSRKPVSYGSYPRWVQWGWIEFGDNIRYSYAEYTIGSDPDPWRTTTTPAPEGTFTTYAVDIQGTNPYQVRFWWNGYLAGTLGSWGGDIPNTGRIGSEIQTSRSQMPGGWNQKQYFDDNLIRYSIYGTWTSFAGTPWNWNSSLFGGQYEYIYPNPNPYTDFSAWDKACSW